MSFTSYWFLLAVALVFFLYYAVPKICQWPLLLVVSYVFYATAGVTCLVYISITTLTTYVTALVVGNMSKRKNEYISSHKEQLSREEKKAYKNRVKRKQKLLLGVTIAVNIGLLAILKYGSFDIIIPLGISFYTFQSVGYMIDVYNEKFEPQTNYGKFALFVGFFPQLSQGPISRYQDLSKTLFEKHYYDGNVVAFGLQRMLWGYFKKLVIADRVAIGLKYILDAGEACGGAYFFVAMVFYAIQLYGDFTGGIDITIGIAEVFGIRLKENFLRPYFSKSIKEYWNRWHISMGSWFTDYVFYPVSVSKGMLNISKWSRKCFGDKIGKRVPVYLSAIIVWSLTGIWHGAGLNFLVWGLANCVVILISQECIPLYRRFHKKFSVEGKMWYKVLCIVRTIFLMSALRMFDCYSDVTVTLKQFTSLFTTWNINILWDGSLQALGLTVTDYVIIIVGVMVMFMVSLLQRKEAVRVRIRRLPYVARVVLWLGLFVVVLLMGAYGQGYYASEFIYNRF